MMLTTTANDQSRCRASLTRPWDASSPCCHSRDPYCMRLAVPLQREPPCPPELTSSCRVRSPCTAATPHAPRLSTRLRTICHVAGHHSHGPGTPLARAATAGLCTVCVRQRSFSVLQCACCITLHELARRNMPHDATRCAGVHVATRRVSLQDATYAHYNTLQLRARCITPRQLVLCNMQGLLARCNTLCQLA